MTPLYQAKAMIADVKKASERERRLKRRGGTIQVRVQLLRVRIKFARPA